MSNLPFGVFAAIERAAHAAHAERRAQVKAARVRVNRVAAQHLRRQLEAMRPRSGK